MNTPPKHDLTEEYINIREVIKPYVSQPWWYVMSVFISLLLSYLFIKQTAPKYQIQSTVLIKDAKNNSAMGDLGMLQDLSGMGKMSTNSIDNEIEIFKSKKLIEKVVKELGLETELMVDSPWYNTELYGNNSPIFIGIVNEKPEVAMPLEHFDISISAQQVIISSKAHNLKYICPYNKLVSLPFANIIIRPNSGYNNNLGSSNIKDGKLRFYSTSHTVNELQQQIKVALVGKETTIIGLSLNHSENNKAKDIINRLVAVYNKDAILDKNSESQKTAVFIDERINLIAQDLGKVETEKESFKAANHITDIAEEAKINLGTDAANQAKQLENDAQLELTNALLGQVNKQSAYQVLPTNIGLNNQDASSNIVSYNQLVIEHARLLEASTAQNPLVVDLSKQINSLRASVVQSLRKNKQALQLAQREYRGLQNRISQKIAKVPYQEKLFRSIERQQEIKENLYLLLLQKREETAISLAVTAPKARIVDSAFASEKPVAPKKAIIMLIGLLIGLLLPVAIIYIQQLFDNKIKSRADLDKASNRKPIFAEIPSLAKNEKELVSLNDISPLAEAFRILITNANFTLSQNKGAKVIYVTSTIKGEGKTFVSMNLSLILANPNRKVVLIGADIRNPQLQRFDNKTKVYSGLTEYLHNDVSTHGGIIYSSPINKNLDIIYSGSIPPNPADLLNNGRFGNLLDSLKQDYDYIIVDTAPLMLVTDTFLIADHADATLYVTRSKITEKSLISFASSTIENKKIKNVGFVLNDVRPENFGYGNKYGYGYHADVKKSWWQKLLK
jgi:tyrosine-protein kinase Etk/Wzc